MVDLPVCQYSQKNEEHSKSQRSAWWWCPAEEISQRNSRLEKATGGSMNFSAFTT